MSSDFLKHELFRVMCGKVLGSGAARTVYEHRQDPWLVIKMEEGHCSFQNILEWETWNRVKETDLAKWFAPCVDISPTGSVLIQRRTTPAAIHPTHVPAFFTDLKCANFGLLLQQEGPFRDARAGQFVCHDYGMHLMLEKGMTKRMIKADWWNLT